MYFVLIKHVLLLLTLSSLITKVFLWFWIFFQMVTDLVKCVFFFNSLNNNMFRDVVIAFLSYYHKCSLLHLLLAISCTHASTGATALMYFKNSASDFCFRYVNSIFYFKYSHIGSLNLIETLRILIIGYSN